METASVELAGFQSLNSDPFIDASCTNSRRRPPRGCNSQMSKRDPLFIDANSNSSKETQLI